MRAKISDNTTYAVEYYDPENYISLNDSGTSHMAAVDQWGNAVSLTTTVNFYWGSQVMTADGIILNDEMDDFSRYVVRWSDCSESCSMMSTALARRTASDSLLAPSTILSTLLLLTHLAITQPFL